MKFKALLLGGTCAVSLTVAHASPGAVDQYNCHRHYDTHEYHCHGEPEEARRRHVLVGALQANDVWTYVNGPSNIFSGVSILGEVGTGPLAFYAGYSLQQHITGDQEYSTTGWNTGVKIGAHVSRLGRHPYATVGYFRHKFNLINDVSQSYAGLQFGGGMVQNWKRLSLDARILYRDPNQLNIIWHSFNFGGMTHNLSFQIGAFVRF